MLSDQIAARGLAPVRLPRWLPTPANRRAERARHELRALVDDLIARRRGHGGGTDLLARLLEARDPETGRGLADDEVADEVMLFLAAGHETTANALALLLHLLARHPRIQARLRDEAHDVLGDRPPTADDVEALAATGRVVDEALRLYPSLHTLVRRAAEDTQLLGHDVPRGRIVAVSTWALHRNPAVWDRPERFDPGRFEGDADRGRHAHLPFGAGPRSCIGVHLARAELVVAVAAAVRAAHLVTDDGPPDLVAGITLRPREPLTCGVADRRRLGDR